MHISSVQDHQTTPLPQPETKKKISNPASATPNEHSTGAPDQLTIHDRSFRIFHCTEAETIKGSGPLPPDSRSVADRPESASNEGPTS